MRLSKGTNVMRLSRGAKAVGAAIFLVGATGRDAAAGETAFRLSDAVIVRADATEAREAEGLKTAAQDLAGIVRNVTGREPAVCVEGREPKGAKARIYLGDTAAARAAGIDGAGLRNGDWRVKTVPGKAFLFGKTAWGAEGALVDFAARHLDYHVVFADGQDVYEANPDARVPVDDFTVRPAIYAREIYHGMSNSRRYRPETVRAWHRYARMTLSSVPASIEPRHRLSMQTKQVCHSQFAYLPPEQHFAEHPEYYGMGPDGQRHGTPNFQSQLCFTNPDAYRLALESLRRFVAADRAANPTNYPCVYDFTQMDNSDWLCLCPACREEIAKYNRVPGGHKEGGDAGLQLAFVNRLAREIRAEYPDVQIRTFAYVSTERAPKPGTIRPEPNVIVWWCDVYSHSDHTLPLETPGHAFNPKQAEELREWMDLTSNIQVWDYMLGGGNPDIAPDAIQSDARLFAAGGIPSLFLEMEYLHQPFYDLNYYLASRLYVDPEQDLDRLIRIYCRGYGRGADDLLEGVQFLRREVLAHPAPTAGDWHTRTLPWKNVRTFTRLGACAKAAYAKEDDAVVRGRLVRILAGVSRDLIELYRRDPSAEKDLRRAIADYRHYGKLSARMSFMDAARRDKAEADVDEEIELLTLSFKDLPAALRDVPPDDLVCVDWHRCRDGRRVEDAASERGRAVEAAFKPPKLACGVYDEKTKEGFHFSVAPEATPPDGRYHWVRLGTCHIGSGSIFWFPGTWLGTFRLGDRYILADGMATDPNWYEAWASVKLSADAVRVDRLAFRRTPPPPGK